MLVEAALLVVVLVVIWLIRFRPKSTLNRRAPYTVLRRTKEAESAGADYVVVGAGPGGLSAVRQLLRRHEGEQVPSILLIEAGAEPLPNNGPGELLQLLQLQRTLLFAPENVRVPVSAVPKGCNTSANNGGVYDEGLTALRPLRHLNAAEVAAKGKDTEAAAAATVEDAKLHAFAYPRGCGVGGGSLIDWGLYLPSALPAGADSGGSWRDTFEPMLPLLRNPLSWAFAEAVAAAARLPKYMSSAAAPYKFGSVFPAFLRTDADGRRLPLAAALLQGEDVSRLQVLVRHRVTALIVAADGSGASAGHGGRVVAVRCMSSRGAADIPVRRGVVLCAGALHTPRILFDTLKLSPLLPPPPPTVPLRDALALPLIFRSFSRVSNDAVNMSSKEALVPWVLTQRGPYLGPLCDTLASVPLPALGPRAELLLLLLPFGGKDAARFYRMGWDRVLGVFPEAATVLIVLQGVETPAVLQLAGEPTDGDGRATNSQGACSFNDVRRAALAQSEDIRKSLTDIRTPASTSAQEHATQNVIEAFQKGMELCRQLVTTEPLCNVCTDAEAIDCTLLLEDPAKAVRLARLMHLPARKKSRQMREESVELYNWAKQVAATQPYMRRYIQQHAYWLGFPSGTAEPFLAPSGCRVAHVSNVTVGDCAAVRPSTGGSLSCGSVATALDMGAVAAEELLLS